MEITYHLCQALQCKSQDIVNAMHFIFTTKTLIQKLGEDGWDILLEKVKLICGKHKIFVPNMIASYIVGRGWSHHWKDPTKIEHHFRVDVLWCFFFFFAIIDSQLQELNDRFRDDTLELLMLCSTLDPWDDYKSFKIDDICKLVEKFYLEYFFEQDKVHLRF